MTLNIRAMGMELTDAIRQYVEEKFNSLEKYSDKIVRIDVDLGKASNHHQKGDVFTCAAIVQIPGDVLKIEKTEEDLYKAVDKVKDHYREALVQLKERQRDIHRKDEKAQ